MDEVVWSINIMIGLLLIGVCVTLYWIFKYDDWNPNPVFNSNISVKYESDDSGHEGMEV